MELAEHPFFSYFPPDRAQQLAGAARPLPLEAGARIFEENAPSDSLFLVLEGEVILTRDQGGGRAIEIARVPPGGYFGELGLLDGSPRSTGAGVEAPAVAARIEGAPFLEALSGAPAETIRSLVSRISGSLRRTNDLLLAETIRKEKLTVLGEMASTIVHDLRSPFMLMGLASEMIAQRHQDEESVRMCGMIDKQIQRATAMVNEILEFAKGNASLDRKQVSVKELLATFASYNHLDLQKKQVELIVSPVEASVICDEEKILRVLQNLANNAADAFKGKPGRIEVSAAANDASVDLLVADNGPGIPERIRATLFEPFVTMDKSKGTGLGLAIAQSVVAAHGGEISFESCTGAGTTFRVSLPAGGDGGSGREGDPPERRSIPAKASS